MSQIFGFGVPVPSSSVPPPAPKRQDPAVQQASNDALTGKGRQGFASQFLTSPTFNATPQTNQEQRLGGYLR